MEWNIDQDILHHKTIKLLLQPIVENEISHGIRGSDCDTNTLKISAFTRNNNIIFEVMNTGNIIPGEQIKALKKSFEADMFPSKHIGMYNVQKRIKLMYGEQYGINIKSEGSYTYVTINIPKEG